MTADIALAPAPAAASLGGRLSPAGGIEILGADLSQPATAELAAQIRQALLDHQIVVVRGQALTKEQQYNFTLNFGELEEHVARHSDGRYGIVHLVTNLDRDGNPTDALDTRGNYFWHTDKSYHAVPSLMIVWRGQQGRRRDHASRRVRDAHHLIVDQRAAGHALDGTNQDQDRVAPGSRC